MALVAHPSAVPLLVTHAWPGSVVEFLGGDRPADHAAGPPDAFHVVVPSLPGYGFSSRPTTAGWGRHADRGRVGRHDWVMTVRRSRR
jgi:pimeloyl-ACP methyl ester carboxylesterase